MIKIVCIGKIKESYLRDGIKEYQKRISKYSKLEIIELEDESNGNILEKEKNKIMNYIQGKDFVITLQIEGNSLDSLQLAKKIDEVYLSHSNITFIIGGSYGLHEDIKKRSNYSLSFSKLTFPHQLFRLMLLEQIYRTYKINNNETYHK